MARPPATEAVHPGARELDRMSAAAIARLMAREEHVVARAVERAAPRVARLAEAVAAALARGGRLLYVGAGSSGRLGVLDAAECPPTFGTDPACVVGIIAGGAPALVRAVEGAEDDRAAGARAVGAVSVSARDVVCGIAASGGTPFTLAALAAARARGALTALVSCAPARAAVDHAIVLAVGPEVLAGSTRLKAGSATKLVLSIITTAAMVRAGRCYGPRMVDLQATNAKLRARALGSVTGETDLGRAAAARLLARAGGSVKLALAMARGDLTRGEAEAALARAGGRLRAVIGPPRRLR